MINQTNQCALITGGSKRIGKEMAIFLAQNGYDVVIHFNKSSQQAQELADFLIQKFGVKSAIVGGDLTNKSCVQNIIDFMTQNFKNWKLLINNASIFNKSKFIENIEDEFEKNLAIHLISPSYLSNFFAKNVLNNNISDAQIINMIDKNTARYDTKYFYYLLSKKCLAEFTKMLALQLAPKIRVNGIAPGYILSDVNSEPSHLNETSKIIPLKRIGDVKNILQTLEFLLKNDFVNGQILSIDGGASLNHAG